MPQTIKPDPVGLYPGYFDPDAEPSAPSGGDADRLCDVFGTTKIREVSAILRKSTYDDDGPDARDRHEQLAAAIGLPPWVAGAGFSYLALGETPDGLSASDLIRTE